MKALALLADYFPGHDVTPNDTLADCGADALDCVQLAHEIDERLGVYIHEDALTLDTTVGEIVEMVEAGRRAAA